MGTGARCVERIIAAHGIATFLAAQTDLVDYAAEKARAVLRRIPDGDYVFWDYLDDDFISRLPVRIRCALRVRDGEVHADFGGTDPQLLAAYNVPTNGARHPWLMLRLMHLVTSTDKTVPLNHGIYRHLSASAPLGCLLNPRRPAAVGVRHASVIRIVDTVAGAVLQADSTLLPVASGGAVIPLVLAEQDARTGTRRSIVVQALICGSGARHGADGTDGRECGMSNMQNSPTERTEDEAGVVVEEYALRPDSGGPGLWRGGTGLIFTLRILREGSALLARGLERFLFRPWGLAGGRAGSTAEVILDRGMPTERRLGKIDVLEMAKGSTLTILTPGGGGFGDPFQRAPANVLDDLRRGYISAAAALRDYGTVISDGEVDERATSALRARHRVVASGFDVGPERERWEQVFDDALVTRLSRALLALPAEAAARMRQSVYYEVAPGLRSVSAPPLQAITDPAAQRALLRARVQALEEAAQ
jgi:N-methylhydantoinase B